MNPKARRGDLLLGRSKIVLRSNKYITLKAIAKRVEIGQSLPFYVEARNINVRSIVGRSARSNGHNKQ